MKCKTLLLASCVSLVSLVYAEHSHNYPPTNNSVTAELDLKKGAQYPGYCAIEVVNYSNSRVEVYGTFEDGTPLDSIEISRYQPHEIYLNHYDRRYRYSFCHNGMYLYIEDRWGRLLYSGYTPVGYTLEVRSYFNNQLKVESKKK